MAYLLLVPAEYPESRRATRNPRELLKKLDRPKPKTLTRQFLRSPPFASAMTFCSTGMPAFATTWPESSNFTCLGLGWPGFSVYFFPSYIARTNPPCRVVRAGFQHSQLGQAGRGSGRVSALTTGTSRARSQVCRKHFGREGLGFRGS